MIIIIEGNAMSDVDGSPLDSFRQSRIVYNEAFGVQDPPVVKTFLISCMDAH